MRKMFFALFILLCLLAVFLFRLLMPAEAAPHHAQNLSNFQIYNSGWKTVGPNVIVRQYCGAGQRAIAGGAEVYSQSSAIRIDRPTDDLIGWQGAYSGPTTHLRVWAMCATIT